MLLRHPRRLRLHGKPGVLLLKRGLLPKASRLGGERARLLLSGALLLLARVGTKGASILLLTWALGITAWVGVRVRVRIHGASSASLAERAGRGGVVTDVNSRSTRGVGEDEDEAVSAPREAGGDSCGHRDERIRDGRYYEDEREEMDAAAAKE